MLNYKHFHIAANILKDVCMFFNVTEEEIIGNGRKRPLPDIRKVYATIFENNKISTTISGYVINKNHSTISVMRKEARQTKEVTNLINEYLYGCKYKIEIKTCLPEKS